MKTEDHLPLTHFADCLSYFTQDEPDIRYPDGHLVICQLSDTINYTPIYKGIGAYVKNRLYTLTQSYLGGGGKLGHVSLKAQSLTNAKLHFLLQTW